jgi:hypothetical protein
MSTGTYIVTRALQKIGAHTKMKPANPDSLENGMMVLNSYISSLQDDDIDTGAVPLDAIGDELSEPQGITNHIVNNLAMELEPDHPGAQISPQLRVNAAKGAAMIRRKYKITIIPKQVVRETLAKGQGNKEFYYYDETYFAKGDTIG